MLRELGGGESPYKTGVPVFQALMRTLYLDHEFGEDDRELDFTKDMDPVIVRVPSFLSLILPEDSFTAESRALLCERLEKLGIDPGLRFAQRLKANFWPSAKFNLVTEFDFTNWSDEALKSTFYDVAK
jgi:hypothetical protein